MPELNKVLNIDAMSLLHGIVDSSIDLMILDPDYQDWGDLLRDGIIEEAVRCIKSSGNILCFTKQPFDYDLRIAVNDYFRREICWSFENGGAWVSNRMPLVSFQKVFWLVKDKEFFFNPRTGASYKESTRDFKRSVKVFGGYTGEGREFHKSEDGIWLRDHLHYNKPLEGEIPAKPQELIDIFINCFCPDGGLVCDPFSGSGVIPITAKRTGRSFVASEIKADRANDINEALSYSQSTIFDFLE